jgi:hypothetical protein
MSTEAQTQVSERFLLFSEFRSPRTATASLAQTNERGENRPRHR